MLPINLCPLAGVLWFEWKPSDLLLLYVCESMVIGFFGELRASLILKSGILSWLPDLVGGMALFVFIPAFFGMIMVLFLTETEQAKIATYRDFWTHCRFALYFIGAYHVFLFFDFIGKGKYAALRELDTEDQDEILYKGLALQVLSVQLVAIFSLLPSKFMPGFPGVILLVAVKMLTDIYFIIMESDVERR